MGLLSWGGLTVGTTVLRRLTVGTTVLRRLTVGTASWGGLIGAISTIFMIISGLNLTAIEYNIGVDRSGRSWI